MTASLGVTETAAAGVRKGPIAHAQAALRSSNAGRRVHSRSVAAERALLFRP